MPEARRVEFVDVEEVVESCRSSRLSKVCSVASGANDTRRLASKVSLVVRIWRSYLPRDLRRASRCCCKSSLCCGRCGCSSIDVGASWIASLRGDAAFTGERGRRAGEAKVGTWRALLGEFGPCLVGDPRAGLSDGPGLRAGMSLSGESGTVGLRIDFGRVGASCGGISAGVVRYDLGGRPFSCFPRLL